MSSALCFGLTRYFFRIFSRYSESCQVGRKVTGWRIHLYPSAAWCNYIWRSSLYSVILITTKSISSLPTLPTPHSHEPSMNVVCCSSFELLAKDCRPWPGARCSNNSKDNPFPLMSRPHLLLAHSWTTLKQLEQPSTQSKACNIWHCLGYSRIDCTGINLYNLISLSSAKQTNERAIQNGTEW